MPVSREAVIYGYRFFLGRDPESELAITSKLSVADESELMKIFVGSAEFKIKSGAMRAEVAGFSNWAADIAGDEQVDILFFGNCQATTFAQIICKVTDLKAKAFELTPELVQAISSGTKDFTRLTQGAKMVVLQPPAEHHSVDPNSVLIEKHPDITGKIRFVPRVAFSAFHPDMGYAHKASGGNVHGFCGAYQSLLTFYAYENKFSVDQAVSLFTPKVFEAVNYFDYFATSEALLIEQGQLSNLPMTGLLNKWKRTGSFMYTLNHPKMFVLTDIVRAFLEREKIPYNNHALDYSDDTMINGPAWGVYPDIARKIGVDGGYFFKCTKQNQDGNGFLDLEGFIAKSYTHFDSYNEHLYCPTLDSDRFRRVADVLKGQHSSSVSTVPDKKNPYQGLPDYQFWRRSIERVVPDEVDPVVRGKFTLQKTDKVATAGSCFAQHISRTLSKNGFNYYVSETGTVDGIPPSEDRNFGVFSARFGNLYTTRQLVQLFDRAYGRFTPRDQAWLRPDGRYVDPFRPQVEPSGYASPDDVEADRSEHLKAVKDMFETLDIFVFTLGLTESWRDKRDGAVFPLAPGVVANGEDAGNYEFVNFQVDDVVNDMQLFIDRLLSVNPSARLVLTVSPVPLMATYEDRHVLVSTTYSKSALRAAADTLVRQNDVCDYFPSYEIITGNFNRGSYYDSDLRSIKEEGVSHVMRLFMKHYAGEAGADPRPAPTPKINQEVMREARASAQVVCDEEALDS